MTDQEKLQADLRKRHLLLEEQLTVQKLYRLGFMAGAGGSGSTVLQFVVNTAEYLEFDFNFTSTGEPIEFTIDWGDGNIHVDSGFGGYYSENHTYAEAGEYTVTVTFDDPLKVLQLDFPGGGDDYASITSIVGLQTLANLQEFRADFNHLETIDFSGLTNLTYIDISDCELPDSRIHSLREVILTGCTALAELRLDDSDFSAGIPDLTGLVNLNYLDLDDSDLSQEDVDRILIFLSTTDVENGYVDLSNGANAAPGEGGLAAKTVLEENGWTVDVNLPPPANVGIAPSGDFNIVGDFTIEAFFNMKADSDFPRLYSFGRFPAANAISIEPGGVYFWANNEQALYSNFSPILEQWHHICVMGSGNTLHMLIDGAVVASAPYGGSISSQGLPLTIGYGNEPGSGFSGLISNFRWTGSAVYDTAGFTTPTTPLTSLAMTKLLIFQGTTLSAQLTDTSGNGNSATNSGATYSAGNPFIGQAGSLQVGTV